MPSREASLENLQKAMANWRPPRPWRSKDEAEMIRRYVFWWFTSRGTKPSGRAWARDLGISHTWLQKLVREFRADPAEMWRLQIARGDPQFEELSRAWNTPGKCDSVGNWSFAARNYFLTRSLQRQTNASGIVDRISDGSHPLVAAPRFNLGVRNRGDDALRLPARGQIFRSYIGGRHSSHKRLQFVRRP